MIKSKNPFVKGDIMDIKQMLPLMLKGKLGEKEQALLKLSQSRDPAALGSLITKMYADKPNADYFAYFKKIVPAELLGRIIKYFDSQNKR